MKLILTIALLVLLLDVSACAQGRPPRVGNGMRGEEQASGQPTIDQILDRYVASLGGIAATKGVMTFSTKGVFEMPERPLKGEYEYYSKAPNKYMTVFRALDRGINMISAFDGNIGRLHSLQPGGEDVLEQEITGTDLAAMKRHAVFLEDFKLREIYTKMTLKTRQKLEDGEAYVIEAMPSDGSSADKLYFDTRSGLLVRKDTVSIDEEGKSFVVQTYYEDYRDVQGMKIPHTYSQVSARPIRNTIYRLNTIEINRPISDLNFKIMRAKP